MSSPNFWDNYNNWIIYGQRNQTNRWSSPDCLETYEKVKKDPRKITYDLEDFDYKRNSYGFRSSEFDNNDPVKILYAGCSYTEGVGIPQEHMWGSFLNDRFSEQIGKPINFYNIGVGGASIDAIVRYIYITVKKQIFKPDAVFALFPSCMRTEIPFTIQESGNFAMYDFIPNFNGYTLPEIRLTHDKHIKSITGIQRLHDAFKSLVFITEFLTLNGIPFYFSTWDDQCSDIQVDKKIITFYEALRTYCPSAVRDHFVDVNMIYQFAGMLPPWFERKFPHNIGRDGAHPGPNDNWNFAKQLHSHVSNKDDIKALIEKWKS